MSVLLECSWMSFSPVVDRQRYVVLNTFLRCTHIIPSSAIHYFIAIEILLHEYAKFCLSILLLKGIWVISRFLLL